MQQLILDIRPDAPRSFDNFIVGANAEAVARLQRLAQPDVVDAVYLWGPPGSGRTHLLGALARAAARPVSPIPADTTAEYTPQPGSLLLADDIEEYGPDAQIAVFRAFINARENAQAMVFAGNAPPLQLPLREDLRTRIGSMLVFEIKPLADAEKIAILQNQAAVRGMMLGPELLEYLLRHGRRDLPSLLGVLEDLDRISLAQRRALTLPLLREVMQGGLF